MLHQDFARLSDVATQISDDTTKNELLQMCRAAGWAGDENRCEFVVTIDGEESPFRAAGKTALAFWLADHRIKQAAAAEKAVDVAQAERAAVAEPMPAPQPSPVAAAVAEAHPMIFPKPEAPMPQPAMVPDAAAAQFLGIIKALAGAGLDEDRVRAIAAEVVAKADRPAPVQIKIGEQPVIALPDGERRHPMFEKVLRLVSAGLNVLLVGPAGTGKSHLAAQVARAMNLDYGALHCTSGASESQLLGWLLPVGENGAFRYVPAQFAKLYKQGKSLFLIDEMDAGDPNFLMVLNGALANGHLHVPQNTDEPSVSRGEGVHVLAACNTYGTGADMIYAGRNQLDASTLDRFYVVHIDYDRTLERMITGRALPAESRWTPAPVDPQTVQSDVRELADWLDMVREKAGAAKLRRVISTRAFQKAAQARAAGIPAEEIRADLLAGWTRDELAKVA